MVSASVGWQCTSTTWWRMDLGTDIERRWTTTANKHPMFRKLMSRQITIDASPPIQRGMRDALDREVFRKSIPILAARVPVAKMGLVLKSDALRGFDQVIFIPEPSNLP